MNVSKRRFCLLAVAACCVIAHPAGASAQAAPAQPVAPDTLAARRKVDSLVRAGAWKAPKPDTVRLPPDTVRAAAFTLDSTLRATAFAAGMVVLIGLGFATLYFAQRFFSTLDRRSPIGVRNHWGGFGGGGGGWEVTPGLSLLTATVMLAVLTAVVASALLGAAGGKAPAAQTAPAPQARP
jgi:hypothetical protein